MTNSKTISPLRDVIATIDRCLEIGAGNAMREDEITKGYIPLKFGDKQWLQAADWVEDIVMSLDGNRIRIIALIAKNQGTGAFRRLITGIIREGLKPVVISPLPQIEEILRGWDWRRVIKGDTFHNRVDEWFPQRKFIEQRKSEQIAHQDMRRHE